MVKRTERGWGAHYCSGHLCLFRRNTLVEYGERKVVVSSVGLHQKSGKGDARGFQTLDSNDNHFETRVFLSDPRDTRYSDADVGQEVRDLAVFTKEIDADDIHNEKHERVAEEVVRRLCTGTLTEHDAEVREWERV